MNHDSDLRLRLRGLPREMAPPERAWEAIASRLGEVPRDSPATDAVPVRRARRLPMALAAAASVVLAVAFVALRPAPPAEPPLLVQQAELIDGEYREALAALPAAEVPAELQPALAELDASAAAILAAIRSEPSADFLLGHLQRTYARRLELTFQAALG
ncbi:hypothetical protein [Coralloluteibacterium thermophilus]|uniref:Anti-sigma factor n=1 Tax=Coralloluteibacterium thermophilum TaxID=2707049 RepID=A0ABV9NHS1_9GAMM